jgi:acylphosphatase
MIQHKKLTVSGKVQGVGYRFSCMEKAYQMNIKGFVKNKKDGTVFVEAEGTPEDLEKFVAWCRKGPVWARVSGVDEREDEVQGYTSFEISR